MYTKTLTNCFIMHFYLLAGDLHLCCVVVVRGCKSGGETFTDDTFTDIYFWMVFPLLRVVLGV